jgi:hypothetical protein
MPMDREDSRMEANEARMLTDLLMSKENAERNADAVEGRFLAEQFQEDRSNADLYL